MLTRKTQQYIMIGDEIRVTVIRVKDKQVCLAINAPGMTSIYRAEVWEKIKNNYTHRKKTDQGNLVLTRKPNQSIYIDNGLIKIVIVEIKGQQVKIGIEAPRELPIYRQEIYDEIPRLAGQTTPQFLKKGPTFSA